MPPVADAKRWRKVRNDFTEAIPAYAATKIVGYDAATGAVLVSQPDEDSLPAALVLVNGPVKIEPGKFGQATFAEPALVQVDGEPATGDELGTVADEWHLAADQTGFVAWSDADDGLAVAHASGGGGGKKCGADCFELIDHLTLRGSVVTTAGACLLTPSYEVRRKCGPVCVTNVEPDAECGEPADGDCTQCLIIYRARNDDGTGALTGVPSVDGCTIDHSGSPKQKLVGCFTVSSEPSDGAIAVIDARPGKVFRSILDPDDCTAPPRVEFELVYLSGAFADVGDPVAPNWPATGQVRQRFVNLVGGLVGEAGKATANRLALSDALAERLDPASPYYKADIVVPPNPRGKPFLVDRQINISCAQSGLKLYGSDPYQSTEIYGVEFTLQNAFAFGGGASPEDVFGSIAFIGNAEATPTNQVLSAVPASQVGHVHGYKPGDVILGAPWNTTQTRNFSQWMAYVEAVEVIVPTTETTFGQVKLTLDRVIDVGARYCCRWVHDALLVASVVGDEITLFSADDASFFDGFARYWVTDGHAINEVIGELVLQIGGHPTDPLKRKLAQQVQLTYGATGSVCVVKASAFLNGLEVRDLATGYVPIRGLIDCKFERVKAWSNHNAGFNMTTSAGLVFDRYDGWGSAGTVDGVTYRDSRLYAFGLEEWARNLKYYGTWLYWGYVVQVGCERLFFFDCDFAFGTDSSSQFGSFAAYIGGTKCNHLHFERTRWRNNVGPTDCYGDYIKAVNNEFAANQGVQFRGKECYAHGNVGGAIVGGPGSTGTLGRNLSSESGDFSGWRRYLFDTNVTEAPDGGLRRVVFRDRLADVDGTYLVNHPSEVGPAWSDPLTPSTPNIWQINGNALSCVAPMDIRRAVVFLPVADADWQGEIYTPAGGWTAEWIFNLQDNGNWTGVALEVGQLRLRRQVGFGGIATLTTAAVAPDSDAWHTVDVHVRGDTVVARVDGVIVINYTEAARPLKFATGYGVQIDSPAGATPSAKFRNIVATPAPEPFASPWPPGWPTQAVAGSGERGVAAKKLTTALVALGVPLTDTSTLDVLLEDSFTGPNGANLHGRALDYGGTWAKDGGGGTWTISGGKAVCSATGENQNLITNAGAGDVLVECDLGFPATDGEMVLFARYTNFDNLWAFGFARHPAMALVRIAKAVAGAWTQWDIPFTFNASTVYRCGVVCSGPTIQLFVNGVVLVSVTDSFNATATKVGLNIYDPYGGGSFDNFRVRALPRPTPVNSLHVFEAYGTGADDGTTITLDLSTYAGFHLTLVGDRTLALVGGHDRQRFSIAIEQGGAGNFEVTWFAGIRWSGGTVPNLTNTAGKIDVFTFVRLNATTFLAVEVGTNY